MNGFWGWFYDFQVTPSDKEQIDGGLDHEGTFTKSKTKKPRQSTRKLYSVKLFPCGPSKNTISMWKGIYYFHTAPAVKFCYHTVSEKCQWKLTSCLQLINIRKFYTQATCWVNTHKCLSAKRSGINVETEPRTYC